MKTWIITEDEIRDIIRNCDEILSGHGSLYAHDSCMIREYNAELNPFWLAVYRAVNMIQRKDHSRFVEIMKDELEGFLNEKYPTDPIAPKIREKAIEVETK